MPLDNAETLSDPFPVSNSTAPGPASSPLRVSLNTEFESGIPPARRRDERSTLPSNADELAVADGTSCLDSALGHVTRTEANLGLLQRGLKHLAASVSAAHEANAELMRELAGLTSDLSRSHEDEHALRVHVGQLEQMLQVARQQAFQEREFLINQQDLFLVEILSDHERQIQELQTLLQSRASGAAVHREMVELIAQRDQAREYATRCERERDAAWRELATGRAPSAGPASDPVLGQRVTPPPRTSDGAARSSESAATAIAAISLRSVPATALTAPSSDRAVARSGTGYSLSGKDLGE